MEFRILGPLEVDEGHGGRIVDVRPLKPRALLAVLVLHAGKAVSGDALAEALWGDDQPKSAANLLQGYVSQLRKALGSDVIQTRPGGYVLVADSDCIDAVRFERMVKEARGARAQTDPAGSAGLLRAALDLWRGRPLADFAFDDFAQAEIGRLQELRLVAEEELAEADLALGQHGELIGRLRGLVEEHPLRERLWGQLVVALYRCGRQAEALRALTDVRRRLAEQLGIEPGPALRRLEEDVLLQRAELDAAPVTPARGAVQDVPSNLPLARSSFIGRDSELEEVDKLLGTRGLVTVVGPGGVGKTRLAVEVAVRVQRRFPDGVWFIPLASVSDPALVCRAVADVLDVREDPGRPLVDTLARSLAGRRQLLLLDNCEHLVEAAASLVDALLDVGPALAVLATSREPLRVDGEIVWALSPLPLPPRDDLAPEALSASDSVRLFCERAASQASFSLNADNASQVATVCRRLDGIPLAIELAAARVRTFTPSQMLRRLDDRFGFLTSGARTAQPRHQTLRAAVEWSHDLLSPAERTLFRRLSVFGPTFSLDAVRTVCVIDDDEGNQVEDVLAALVDHSLVAILDADGERRFGMLETLRAYAAERLVEADEEKDVRARFIAWAVDFAESFSDALDARLVTGKQTLERLDVDHENLRLALRWAVSAVPRDGVRLWVALAPFWAIRGYFDEGQRWADNVLAAAPDLQLAERADVLRFAGRLAISAGDIAEAQPRLEEALALYRELGQVRSAALALAGLALIANEYLCDLPMAEGLGNEVIRLHRHENNHHLLSEARAWHAVNAIRRGSLEEAQRLISEAFEYNVRHADDPCPVLFVTAGWVAFFQGDLHRGRALLERSLAHSRDVGGKAHLPGLLGRLGEVALVAGDVSEAFERFSEQLSVASEIGDRWEIEFALRDLARVAMRRGDAVYARSAVDQSVRMARSSGRTIQPDDIDAWAGLLRLEGRAEDAVRLLGAAEARREALGMPLPPVYVAGHERLVAEVTAGLEPDSVAEAWSEGRQLAVEDVLDLAFSRGSTAPASFSTP